MSKKSYVIVMDTDGATGPTNPGYCGSGIHGYIYDTENIGKSNTNVPPKYHITEIGYIEADLFKSSNYQDVIPEEYFDGSFSYTDEGTNNVAEVNAFTKGLTRVLANYADKAISKVILRTDSNYLLHIIEKVKTLDRPIWDVESTVNLSLWQDVDMCLKTLKEMDCDLEPIKVIGHSTSLGNIYADMLAVMGKHRSIRGTEEFLIHFLPEKKYWDKKLKPSPLIDVRQVFFRNDYPGYMILKYPSSNKALEIGAKTSEALFGYVLLKEPPVEIERLRIMFQERGNHYSTLDTVSLLELYNRDNQHYQALFPDDFYQTYKGSTNIKNLFGTTVFQAILPAGLANQSVKNMTQFSSIITDYSDNQTKYREFVDITDKIYNAKKKCILEMSQKQLTIEHNGIKYALDLGNDTLTRNHFNKIHGKVYLVIDKIEPEYHEYYTLIDCNDGIGVYCNFYSCRVFTSAIRGPIAP